MVAAMVALLILLVGRTKILQPVADEVSLLH